MAGRTITGANLINRVRSRIDMASSPITDSEFYDWLNSSTYPEFYNEVLSSRGEDFLTSLAPATTVAGEDTYYFTDNFTQGGVEFGVMSVKGVDLVVSVTEVRELTLVGFNERNLYTGRQGYPSIYYLVDNNRIVIRPVPSGAFGLRIWYTPTPPEISALTDIDCYGGWEGFLIADLASKALSREESDNRNEVAERERWRAIIRSAARKQAAEGKSVSFVWGRLGPRYRKYELPRP